MKRDYNSGVASDVTMFVGTEVEKTPMYGEVTLFVTGIKSVSEINGVAALHRIQHIYCGANHSFHPEKDSDWHEWDEMVQGLLDLGYWVSLDMDVKYAEGSHESGWSESNKFIPIISVKLAYLSLFNYNTIVKIDDKDFNATNPGVWSWPLNELLDRSKFTRWDAYKDDEIIK